MVRAAPRDRLRAAVDGRARRARRISHHVPFDFMYLPGPADTSTRPVERIVLSLGVGESEWRP